MKASKNGLSAASDSSLEIQLTKKRPIAEELADRLREKIRSGELPCGARLPSTQQLAAQWGTYVPAVHAALAALTKEGLLDRLRRKGTFVRESEARLARVGILVPNKMWGNPEGFPFVREVFTLLEEYLLQRNVRASVWFEIREGVKSNTALAPIVKAAEKQEIQALIALNSGAHNASWLNALPIPVTGFSDLLHHHVGFCMQSFFDLAVKALHDAGCRSVGLIEALPESKETPPTEAFYQAAKKMNMKTDGRWVRAERDHAIKQDEFGYEAFRSFHSLSEKPDGLIVYPDSVAKGVMLGITIAGVSVPSEMHVVFHKNAEIPFLCPLEAIFVESSCMDCVKAFYDQLTRIHKGEKCPTLPISYTLSRGGLPPLTGQYSSPANITLAAI